ncbi:MAG: helix-turn-helix transcriptional regulator [Collinsella sp.]|nr:helix-turn-helix transcriptional regulator [Collinsella sp.]
MNSVFFFYTMFILVVCIVAAVISISAFASSRRRFFFFSCALFVCYALEMCEIFFFEFISQNVPFPAEQYYAVNTPLLRTLIATVTLAFTWFIAMDIADVHSRRLALTPVGIFVAANAVVLLLFPEGAVQQFIYYSLRQAFLSFMLIYLFYAYRRQPDNSTLKLRLQKYRPLYFMAWVLVGAIFIEDIIVILVIPPTLTASWLPLYLSERNFSENVLMCASAVVVIAYAYHVLSIHMKEAPIVEEVPDLDRHIDEMIPFYRDAHKLSKRETEVLRLVLLGHNNQEIANELFLAVGTVKTHVHNILKKTGQPSREALVLHFWKS